MRRILLLLAAVLTAPSAVDASGQERSSSSDDLIIQTDTRWAGGVEGGYLPVRIQVINHGPSRDLTFVFSPYGNQGGETVERTIGAEQNATVRFTLPIPLVGRNDGMLRVYSQGRELGQHSRNVSDAYLNPESVPPACMLIVSPTVADPQYFFQAVNQHLSATRRPWGAAPAVDAGTLAQVVPATSLPDSWIDYTSLDIVAISREDLQGLDRAVRTALLKWVQCGGNLLVYNVGRGKDAFALLDRALDISERAAVSSTWQKPGAARPSASPPKSKRTETNRATKKRPSSGMAPTTVAPAAAATSITETLMAAFTVSKDRWPDKEEAFHSRDFMLGQVTAFPENPFPGTTDDWSWFLTSIRPERHSWMGRHGMSSRMGSDDFYSFMNMGIRSVPTVAFLVMISAFAIVIGPVNFIVLKRKKMAWLLLITVPVIALGTTTVLLGYSLVAHGFSVRSRMRSLTVLDQKNRTAVTMARMSLFAGMAPSGGMRFSPDTAVYPLYAPLEDFRRGNVDWTQAQVLASGWLPAHTRTQFFTMHNGEQRARLEVKPASKQDADKGVRTLEASNGLPWDLEALLVADEAGHIHFAKNVSANAAALLVPAKEEDLIAMVRLLGRNAPELPPGFVSPRPGPFDAPRRMMWYAIRGGELPRFESNLMERRIAALQAKLPRREGLSPRSYFAVLRQNPGVETGVPGAIEQAGCHFLLGYY